MLDEFDTRHALAERSATTSRNSQQPHRIAQRQRARVDDVAEALVGLRVHDHLRAERYDLRPGSATRKIEDALRGCIGIDRIEVATEDIDALSFDRLRMTRVVQDDTGKYKPSAISEEQADD